MKIDILTLFPEMFEGPFDQSMIRRAREKGLVELNIHNLRDWSEGKHKTVDGKPYGGGKGMLIRVDVVDRALGSLKKEGTKVILLSPQGEIFSQKKARELVREKHIIFVCGHYEGFDNRIRERLIDEEISIGNYVLTGGEIPAMVLSDSVVRLVPGVLAKEATEKESHFHEGELEYPQYTKPPVYRGWEVPEIVKSGDHGEIEKWKAKSTRKRDEK